MSTPADAECWRTSRVARYGTLTLFGGLAVVAPVDNALNGQSWLDGLTVSGLLMTLWLVFAWRPSLCLDRDGVVVRNPLWTHRIPLVVIRDAAPGYFGVVIKRHGRRPVVAWAVQQTNVADAVGAQTRAATVAEAIRKAAQGDATERE